jgi:hypothetical protein
MGSLSNAIWPTLKPRSVRYRAQISFVSLLLVCEKMNRCLAWIRLAQELMKLERMQFLIARRETIQQHSLALLNGRLSNLSSAALSAIVPSAEPFYKLTMGAAQ